MDIKLKDYIDTGLKSHTDKIGAMQTQVSQMVQTVKLDVPDSYFIIKGGSIELFKYGMYLSSEPYEENKYNIRLVNLNSINQYSDRIVINCPADYTGTTLKNSSTSDKPMFQLLDKAGNVLDSKRVDIYVADKSKVADTSRKVAYIGDSFTAMGFRSGECANLLKNTYGLTNTSLIGKFVGDGTTTNLTLTWIDSKGITSTGAEETNNTKISTDYLNLDANPTYTFNTATKYFYVYEYDSSKTFIKTLIDTKRTGTFTITKGHLYRFSMWSGTTDLSSLKSDITVSVQGSGNKYTGTGGYTWYNYVDNPSTLPTGFPNNYLWDTTKNDISFTSFMSGIGETGSIDYVVVLLGWNDFENGSFSANFSWDTITAKSKYFIEKLHSEYPSCKIILESYHYGYPKNTISYGSTMPQVRHNPYIFALNNLYQTIANNYDYVEFVHMSSQIDVFHNMNFTDKTVNKRSTETIKYCTDLVHPAPIGFYQYADAETNALLYLMQTV